MRKGWIPLEFLDEAGWLAQAMDQPEDFICRIEGRVFLGQYDEPAYVRSRTLWGRFLDWRRGRGVPVHWRELHDGDEVVFLQFEETLHGTIEVKDGNVSPLGIMPAKPANASHFRIFPDGNLISLKDPAKSVAAEELGDGKYPGWFIYLGNPTTFRLRATFLRA